MPIANLILALPGAAAQGLIWGIMAIGVYLTFRVLDIADLTVDGTMCTGGAVCVMMMLSVLPVPHHHCRPDHLSSQQDSYPEVLFLHQLPTFQQHLESLSS